MDQTPQESPVLVIDALGVSNQIQYADADGLLAIADNLDRQYVDFQKKVPNSIVTISGNKVTGSSEFSWIRMNDMFVLYSEGAIDDHVLRYLVSSDLLYQQLLISGFIPRGGLGFGLTLRRNDLIIGSGFLDAYRHAEQRPKHCKDICAIELSPGILQRMPNTKHACQLLCMYQGRFYINPGYLSDPEMGTTDYNRVMSLLRQNGANQAKLSATEQFLSELEDYESAMEPGSKSRAMTGWKPQ